MYRLTERNELDEIIRIVADNLTFDQVVAVERESIPAEGNHLRLERVYEDDTVEYL